MVTETYWRATHHETDVAGSNAEGKLSLSEKALAEQVLLCPCFTPAHQLKARQGSHRQVLECTERKNGRQEYICNLLRTFQKSGRHPWHRSGATDHADQPP